MKTVPNTHTLAPLDIDGYLLRISLPAIVPSLTYLYIKTGTRSNHYSFYVIKIMGQITVFMLLHLYVLFSYFLTSPPLVTNTFVTNSGADNVANDGVYSAYFISQTGNGYYSLKV